MLLPFVTGAGQLLLVDPSVSDGAPLIVDSGLPPPTHPTHPTPIPYVRVNLVPAGTYDPVQNTIADQHRRFVWYQKGGMLFRVDLLKTNAHVPVQISSVTDTCYVHGMAVDYGDPLDSLLMIMGAGDDGECYTDDDRGYVVTLGAASDDSGVAVPPELEILDWISAQDGSVQRLIVSLHRRSTARTIESYAPDLSSSKELLSLDAVTTISLGPDASRTQQYFLFQPAGGSPALYRYDAGTDALSPLYEFPMVTLRRMRADRDHLYFHGDEGLYRIAHASTEPQLVGTGIGDFCLTANRIVYEAAGNSLESVPKSGGTPSVLEPAGPTGVRISAVVGTRVYYSRGAEATGGLAQLANEDGTGAAAVPNAVWLGTLTSPDDEAGGLEPWPSARTLLLGTHQASGGVTVRGVDAETGIAGPVLGTIPGSRWAPASGVGRYVRLDALVERDGGTADFDAHFADVQTAGSLRAAATTSGLDDASGSLDAFYP